MFFRIPDAETIAMPDEADNTTVTPAGGDVTTPLAFLMVIKDVMIEGCLGESRATDGWIKALVTTACGGIFYWVQLHLIETN